MSDLCLTDQAVVARMLAGDEAAFEAFFTTCFSRLYRFDITRLDNNAPRLRSR